MIGDAVAILSLLLAVALLVSVAFGVGLVFWLELRAHRATRDAQSALGDAEAARARHMDFDAASRSHPVMRRQVYGISATDHSTESARTTR